MPMLWQPSIESIEKAQMTQFMRAVNHQHDLSIKNYPELYQWSIDFPELFWSILSDFCEVIYSKPCDSVLIDKDKMPGAKWFTGAQLNFAENLLRHAKNPKPALIFRNERDERRVMTFPQLHDNVAKFSQALKNHGIRAGDRVAAIMPNMPETIVAMLAAASLGAIFSSCSPDFGVSGLYDRLNQIQPKILLTTDGYFYKGKNILILDKISELKKNITSLEKIIVLPYVDKALKLPDIPQSVLYQDFLNSGHATLSPPYKNDEYIQLPFDHPLYIMYSSGTTGIPKCIVHGAGGTLLQHLKEHVLHTDLQASDILFYFTTCGWMMWNWSVSALATGATLLLYDGCPFFPKRSSLYELLEKEKVTVFGTSAKFISASEKFNIVPNEISEFKALRTILTTGSPLLSESFDYVYTKIKKDLCLSSISGGTDIISCFALGNPILPVYREELQCRGLGLKVEIFNDDGHPVKHEKGELVCTAPFPAMPIYFWNDPDQTKYRSAYFEKFPGIWAHGDYAKITEHDGLIIYGRSDATLNPGGIRIGTAEIYKTVESIDHVLESIVIGQAWKDDIRIVLFVKLEEGFELTEEMKEYIKKAIKQNASPHHVPAKILQVSDIPRTLSGKIMELAVRDVVEGREIKNKDAIANPEALELYKNLDELQKEM